MESNSRLIFTNPHSALNSCDLIFEGYFLNDCYGSTAELEGVNHRCRILSAASGHKQPLGFLHVAKIIVSAVISEVQLAEFDRMGFREPRCLVKQFRASSSSANFLLSV